MNTAPSTGEARSRDDALRDLNERQAKSLEIGHISNDRLYAGERMVYYCGCCGRVAELKHEEWIDPPPKQHCQVCQADIDAGLIRPDEDKLTQEVPTRDLPWGSKLSEIGEL